MSGPEDNPADDVQPTWCDDCGGSGNYDNGDICNSCGGCGLVPDINPFGSTDSTPETS